MQKLPNAKNDTEKFGILDQLAFEYSTTAPATGIRYANQALELAKNMYWERSIATAYSDMGINYAALSANKDALRCNFSALAIYKKLEISRSQAAVLSNIALIYSAEADYTHALQYDFMALRLNKALGETHAMAVVLENIGSIYFEQKILDQAEEYYNKAFDAYLALNDTNGIARNIGNRGIVQDALGHYRLALKSHHEALRLNTNSQNKYGIQVNLANVGYVFYHLKLYDSALHYQLRALRLSEELGGRSNIAVNLGNIGETYLDIAADSATARDDKKRTALNSAISYLQKAIFLCTEINFTGPLIEFKQYLSHAYYLAGNYRLAFDVFKQYSALKDSIFSIEKAKEISKLETEHQVALKNKDLLVKDKELQLHKLEVLRKRNQSLVYVLSIILLCGTMGLILRLLYIYRLRNRKLSKEQERFAGQLKTSTDLLQEIAHIQAHNIRGPVATILGLAQNFNYEDFSDPNNKIVIEGINTMTEQLDETVKDVIKKENSTRQ